MITSAPAAIQRRLPIAVEVSFLSSIDAARRDLRTDEDEVSHLISDRQLLAFDLRTPDANTSFVRIWTESIEICKQSRARQQAVYHPTNWDKQVDAIIEKIIGFSAEHKISATSLSKRWVTSATHIHNLIAAKQLALVPGTGDSINKTPLVLRKSAVEFLKQRRLS